MKKHDPIYKTLGPQKKTDLASITRHPGMAVLIEDLARGHLKQQLNQIMDVDVDDPERITKLAAISATAYAMDLFIKLLEQEMGYNFKAIQDEEENQRQKDLVAQ